jgi:hypothetical protein
MDAVIIQFKAPHMEQITAAMGMLALCCTHLANAQVYKWVDEKGVTQYTTTPSPQGKGQKIVSTPASGTAARPQAKEKTWQEKEIEFRERRANAAEQQHKEENERNIARLQAAEKRESCIAARTNLHALTEQRPMFSINERGERVYVEDKERPRMIEDLKQVIARDCPK